MQRTTSPWLPALLCLALTQLATAQDPAGKLLPFDAAKHGFNFANHWQGEIRVDVPVLGSLDLASTSYGLCGGMSMAAMDSFLIDAEIPDFAESPGAPPNGSALRRYIRDRQQDAFKAENGLLMRRLAAWNFKPSESNVLTTGLHELSDRQFQRIVVPQIDAGRPVNLCLVRSDAQALVPTSLDKLSTDGFAKNHQVLAIGYRMCQQTAGCKQHWALDVYDPDHPGRIMSLHPGDEGTESPRLDADGILIDDPKSYTDPEGARQYASFRAFFAVPYSQRTPPWASPTAGKTAAAQPIDYLDEAEPTASVGGAKDPVAERFAAIERRLDAIEARLGAGPVASPPAAEAPTTEAAAEPATSEGDLGLDKEKLEAMRRDPRFVGGIRTHRGIDRAANDALKGRTGRLVSTYPKDAKVTDEWLLFAAGEAEKYLTYGRGAIDTELVPGRYAIVVNKTRIEAVEVASRHDTRVPLGALRLNVGKATEWQVFAPSGTDYLTYGRGPRDLGLVPGNYEIEINKQREKVTVKAGEVTEY